MSHASPRSVRVKREAQSRPDMVWWQDGQRQEKQFNKTNLASTSIVTGGSELSQLIAESDAHLAAMRKIVQ